MCMSVCKFIIVFFFFKQKTAYEMRISDWSSDVCSSDLTSAAALAMIMLFCILSLLLRPHASASISFLLGDDLRQLQRIDIAARQGDERRVGHRHLPREHGRQRRLAAGFDDEVKLFERQPHRIAHLAARHADAANAARLKHGRSEEHTSE